MTAQLTRVQAAQSVFHLNESAQSRAAGTGTVLGSVRIFRDQDAVEAVVRRDRPAASAWSLFEDRPRKFGWINEIADSAKEVQSTIVFDFLLPAALQGSYLLLVTYMKTYSNAGKVQVRRRQLTVVLGKSM